MDKNTLWVERYRPKTLDGYVGNDHIKSKFKQYIDENDPPHVLLYGKAGTGKTTLARILTNNVDCDDLYINASDETGVDIVRTKIKPFAASVSFAKVKIVILDEFDYMSPNSQAALRNLMEQFSRTTRFILTCNYHEKIIDPIISRCQLYEVVPPSKTEVAMHLGSILQTENVSFNPADIKILIDSSYPDIRQLINKCQRNSFDGKLVIDTDEIIDSDFKLKLLEILTRKNKNELFTDVRKLVADNHVSDFTEVYRFLYEKVDDITNKSVPNVISAIAEGMKNDVFVVDKEINFMNTIINILIEI